MTVINVRKTEVRPSQVKSNDSNKSTRAELLSPSSLSRGTRIFRAPNNLKFITEENLRFSSFNKVWRGSEKDKNTPKTNEVSGLNVDAVRNNGCEADIFLTSARQIKIDRIVESSLSGEFMNNKTVVEFINKMFYGVKSEVEITPLIMGLKSSVDSDQVNNMVNSLVRLFSKYRSDTFSVDRSVIISKLQSIN